MPTNLRRVPAAPGAIAAALILLLLSACAAPMTSDDSYFLAQNAARQSQASVSSGWHI